MKKFDSVRKVKFSVEILNGKNVRIETCYKGENLICCSQDIGLYHLIDAFSYPKIISNIKKNIYTLIVSTYNNQLLDVG